MAILINNGVQNINGTPGAISGIFIDRPAAADVADGTLYFATDTAAIYQTVAGIWVNYSGGGGGSQNLQQTLNIGNSAIDKSILTSDSGAFLTNIQVANSTNAILSRMAANYVGTQKIGSDNYSYLTIAGTTPYLINHNATGNRESRFLPTNLYFKDLTSGEILTVNAPATINNNTINFQNASGTLAFLTDISTPGIDSVLAQSQLFTNNRQINCNNFEFDIVGLKYLSLQTLNGTRLDLNDAGEIFTTINFEPRGFIYNTSNQLILGDYSGSAGTSAITIDNTSKIVSTNYENNINGLSIDFDNLVYRLGNYTSNKCYLVINDNFYSAYFSANDDSANGMYLDMNQGIYSYGDVSYSIAGIHLDINCQNEKLFTTYQNNQKGIIFDFPNQDYYLGDIANGAFVDVNVFQQKIFFVNTPGSYNFQNVPAYTDNADAIANGLVIGDIYRHDGALESADQLRIVH